MPIRQGLQPHVVVYIVSFLSALVLRISLDTTTVEPDSRLYLRIAENIVHNGCYSRAPVESAECVPTWGNQPPGYPLFIVGVKLLTRGTPDDIVATQCLVYALAAAYVLYAVKRSLNPSAGLLLIIGLLISVSPLTASWSQWVLTETLAASAALVVTAECLRSLSSRVFRTGPLMAALCSSLMIRWDHVWLVLPVALVAWQLRERGGMARRMASVLGAMAIPVLLLMVRAGLVGLPATPPYIDATPEEIPPGILTFWKVTAVRQTAASTLLWRVWRGEYGVIVSDFDYRSVSDAVDATQLRHAIGLLSAVPDGAAIPRSVDDAFADLARKAEAREGGFHRLNVLSRRGLSMWVERDTITWSGWFRDHETYLRPYRVALLGLVLIAPFAWPRGSPQQVLAAGVLLFVVTRTMFLAWLTAVETRYTTPPVPAMEVVAAMLIGRLPWSLAKRARSAWSQGPTNVEHRESEGVDVSVIVPVHDKAPYLADCVESILNQTLTTIEVICVDDASTDGSGEILGRFAERDARVRIIRHTRNRGAAAARNTGLAAARGQFVQFTDADDLLPRDALGLLLARARRENVQAVRGGLEKFSTDNPDHVLGSEIPVTLARLRPMDHPAFWVPWWHTSYLFSRQFLQSEGIHYPDLRNGEDPVFLAHVLTRLQSLSTISDVTYRYRLRSENGEAKASLPQVKDYLRHVEMIRDLFLDAYPGVWHGWLGPFLRPQVEAMVRRALISGRERRSAERELATIFEPHGAGGASLRPRRLLFLYNVCGPGGVETSISNKIEALRPLGVEARALFESMWGGEGRFDPARPGFEIEADDEARRRIIEDWAPDAVVVIDAPWLIDTVGRADVRCPVLFESHLSEPAALDWRVRGGISDLRVCAILVPSAFNRALLAAAGADTRLVRVIPNVVDGTMFRRRQDPDIRPGLGLPRDRRLIMFVGRLEPAKNPLEFAQVCAELLKRNQGVHAVVIGDAVDTVEYAASFRAEADRLTSGRVSFIGRLAHYDMPMLYTAVGDSGGCLLSTSRNESQPMVVLEAMACGCPVVASDVGGLREIVDDGRTGHLYQIGDVQGAAGAISDLMNDRDHRSAVIEAAERYVRTCHGPAGAAIAYATVLDEVGAGTRRLRDSRRRLRRNPDARTAATFVPLPQRLRGLFAAHAPSDGPAKALPYAYLAPGIQLGFEPSATVEIERREMPYPGRVGRQAIVIAYRAPSRWLTIEVDLDWAELLQTEHYQFALDGRPSRLVRCRATLRVPLEGEAFTDFRMCDFSLAPGATSASGGGWIGRRDLSALQQGRSPRILFFFSSDADLTLELENLAVDLA